MSDNYIGLIKYCINLENKNQDFSIRLGKEGGFHKCSLPDQVDEWEFLSENDDEFLYENREVEEQSVAYEHNGVTYSTGDSNINQRLFKVFYGFREEFPEITPSYNDVRNELQIRYVESQEIQQLVISTDGKLKCFTDEFIVFPTEDKPHFYEVMPWIVGVFHPFDPMAKDSLIDIKFGYEYEQEYKNLYWKVLDVWNNHLITKRFHQSIDVSSLENKTDEDIDDKLSELAEINRKGLWK